jgi:predicted negative regulator of RcsB-dependent stress response
MKNIFKKSIVFAIVLALVVSCTAAFAFNWKQWGKSFGNQVEAGAEQYADDVEETSETPQAVDSYVGNVLSFTNTFLGGIFSAFSK